MKFLYNKVFFTEEMLVPLRSEILCAVRVSFKIAKLKHIVIHQFNVTLIKSDSF